MRVRRSLLIVGILGLGVLGIGGCSNSPDDRYIGVYSLDGLKSELPKFPGRPDLDIRVLSFTRNFRLKLLADHTFSLATNKVIEGEWKVDKSEILLTTKSKDALALLGDKGVRLKPQPDHSLVITRDSVVGKLKLWLRKTG